MSRTVLINFGKLYLCVRVVNLKSQFAYLCINTYVKINDDVATRPLVITNYQVNLICFYNIITLTKTSNLLCSGRLTTVD